MEVKIDYLYELIENEKLKIKWVIDEFDAQFGDRIGRLTSDDIIQGMEFIDYIISSVDTDNPNPEVLSFLRRNLERLEKRYPIFF
jgi:hypothetical protein